MATLLDTIRGNLGRQATQQAPMTDEGERVRKLLGAKTGKASTQAAPDVAQSNLAEASMVDQTRMGQQQLAADAQIQSQQLAQTQQGLQQQEQVQRAGLDLQQKANTLQNKIQTDQLLGDLSRDRSSLSLERDKSKLEQLSHNLALQDKQYVANLQRMGEMNRLNDGLQFREEMTKTIFADNNSLLSENLARDAARAQSARDWNQYLAKNNLAYIIDMDKRQTRAANEAAKWSAGGQILGAGIGMAAGRDWSGSGSQPQTSAGTGQSQVAPGGKFVEG